MTHLTKYEAAVRLRVSMRTLERWVKDGRLTIVRLSPGSVRIDSAEVDRLLGAAKSDVAK